MEFKNKNELKEFLSLIKKLDYGATATVYHYPRAKIVLKISNEFNYKEGLGIFHSSYDLSKFDGVQNDTYVLPHEIVKVGFKPVGIVYPYVSGESLYRINPLTINLKEFENHVQKAYDDTILLSNDGLMIYDMPYNTMLSKEGIKVIDTEDYPKPNITESEIESSNIQALNITIKDFLVNGFFENFIKSRKDLYELYRDNKINITAFLKEFRKYLSECIGKDIEYLSEAQGLKDKTLSRDVTRRYIRMY